MADASTACTDLDSSSYLPLPSTTRELNDLNVIVDGLIAQGRITKDTTIALGGTRNAQENKWINSDGRKSLILK